MTDDKRTNVFSTDEICYIYFFCFFFFHFEFNISLCLMFIRVFTPLFNSFYFCVCEVCVLWVFIIPIVGSIFLRSKNCFQQHYSNFPIHAFFILQTNTNACAFHLPKSQVPSTTQKRIETPYNNREPKHKILWVRKSMRNVCLSSGTLIGFMFQNSSKRSIYTWYNI